ncbi:MAG: carboxymuconolactone decarboxylase family protein [Burkholderiales bacterium]|nr:carboxymuconolactone decarboxylase family protein [Burkholderiales bacterium]
MNKTTTGTSRRPAPAARGRAARFPVLAPAALTAPQRRMMRALVAGPRGEGKGGAAAIERFLAGGPFNAWLRSPDLGERLQRVGEYIRFGSSLPRHLNEFAILIVARFWTAQFEWYAHLPMALDAGLDPRLAAALAENRRPARMKKDEAAVYDFCTQLHRRHDVTDAAYRRVVDLFGEQGAMDLIGVSGYYTAVSMTLNVARVPLPDGRRNPLKRAR